MWNGTTLLVFYGLAAAVIVLMLVRLWRKRQRPGHLDPREAAGERWSLERVPLERPTAAADGIDGELNVAPVSILKPAARSTSPATVGGLDDGPGADWRDRERYVTGWSDRTPGDSPLPRLTDGDQKPK